MAEKKISQLTAKGANLDATDLLVISEDAGGGTYVTKSITGQEIIDAASGGGGGLTYFTEAENTSTPNGTVYVDSLTAAASSTNADFAIVPKGTGAILANVPDNTTAGGNKRGQYAVDWSRATRIIVDQVASGNYSVIGGGRANKASGTESGVNSGYYNVASGTGSVVSGGHQNNSISTQSAVGGGYNNNATSSYAFVGGGISNTASGFSAFVPGGYGNVSSNNYAMAVGFWNTSSGDSSATFGKYNVADATGGMACGQSASTLSIIYRHSYSSNSFAAAGDNQVSKFLMKVATTTNTATSLTTNGSVYANGTNNYILLSNQSAFRFKGTIVGKQSGSTNAAVWDVDGFIVRGANAAATTLVVSNVTVVSNVPAWGTPTLAADTTIGCLNIQVTGASATNIRWMANIETTEVIYA